MLQKQKKKKEIQAHIAPYIIRWGSLVLLVFDGAAPHRFNYTNSSVEVQTFWVRMC